MLIIFYYFSIITHKISHFFSQFFLIPQTLIQSSIIKDQQILHWNLLILELNLHPFINSWSNYGLDSGFSGDLLLDFRFWKCLLKKVEANSLYCIYFAISWEASFGSLDFFLWFINCSLSTLTKANLSFVGWWISNLISFLAYFACSWCRYSIMLWFDHFEQLILLFVGVIVVIAVSLMICDVNFVHIDLP